MARNNNGTSTNYFSAEGLDIPARKVSGQSQTVSCWFRAGSTVTTSNLVFLVDSAGGYFGVLFDGGNAYGLGAGKVICDNGSINPASSTTIASTSTWNHICGTRDGISVQQIFLNGGGKGTGTAGGGALGNNICAGVFKVTGGGVFSNMNGDLAEIACWDWALSDAQVAALAAGVPPPLIQPDKLWFYNSMRAGSGSLLSAFGGVQTTGITEQGTMAASTSHPPVFSFNPVEFEPFQAAGAVSASLVVSPMQTLLNQLLAR